MLPSQWVVVGSDVLTVVLAGLGVSDLYAHTHLLTNPITLIVLAILGGLGIHQTVKSSLKKKV